MFKQAANARFRYKVILSRFLILTCLLGVCSAFHWPERAGMVGARTFFPPLNSRVELGASHWPERAGMVGARTFFPPLNSRVELGASHWPERAGMVGARAFFPPLNSRVELGASHWPERAGRRALAKLGGRARLDRTRANSCRIPFEN